MSKIIKWNFEVETIEAGQRRRYGDSYYHYIVTSNRHEYDVKNFCTKVLKPAISPEERLKMSRVDKDGAHFATHWTSFKRLKDGRFEYKAESASTH